MNKIICEVCRRERVDVCEGKTPAPDDDRCWNHIGQDPRCYRLGYERLLEEAQRQNELLGHLFLGHSGPAHA